MTAESKKERKKLTAQELFNIGKNELTKESPIDIKLTMLKPISLPLLKWNNLDIAPRLLKLTNSGQSVILSGKWFGPRPFLSDGPLLQNYIFSQIHFHWGPVKEGGSEHTFNGVRMPLEMHVMFFKREYLSQKEAAKQYDGLINLAYLTEFQEEDSLAFKPIVDTFHRIGYVGATQHIKQYPLSHFFPPFSDDYYLYWGDVCFIKTVMWLICRKPLPISTRQVESFRTIRNHNREAITASFRSTVSVKDKTVFHVNPNDAYSEHLIIPLSELFSNKDVIKSKKHKHSSSLYESDMSNVNFVALNCCFDLSDSEESEENEELAFKEKLKNERIEERERSEEPEEEYRSEETEEEEMLTEKKNISNKVKQKEKTIEKSDIDDEVKLKIILEKVSNARKEKPLYDKYLETLISYLEEAKEKLELNKKKLAQYENINQENRQIEIDLPEKSHLSITEKSHQTITEKSHQTIPQKSRHSITEKSITRNLVIPLKENIEIIESSPTVGTEEMENNIFRSESDMKNTMSNEGLGKQKSNPIINQKLDSENLEVLVKKSSSTVIKENKLQLPASKQSSKDSLLCQTMPTIVEENSNFILVDTASALSNNMSINQIKDNIISEPLDSKITIDSIQSKVKENHSKLNKSKLSMTNLYKLNSKSIVKSSDHRMAVHKTQSENLVTKKMALESRMPKLDVNFKKAISHTAPAVVNNTKTGNTKIINSVIPHTAPAAVNKAKTDKVKQKMENFKPRKPQIKSTLVTEIFMNKTQTANRNNKKTNVVNLSKLNINISNRPAWKY